MNLKYWDLCVCITERPELFLEVLGRFYKKGTFISLQVWKMDEARKGRDQSGK